MGIIQKEAVKTTILSTIGLVLGYLNKAVLFLILLSPSQVGLVNLTITVALLFSQFSNLGTIYTIWRFFPFFRSVEKGHYGFLKFNMLLVFTGVLLFSILLFVCKPQVVSLYNENSPAFVEYYLWVIPIGIAHVYFVLFDNYLRGLYKNFLSVFANEIVLRLLVLFLLILLYAQAINFHQFFVLHAIVYFVPVSVLLVHLIYTKELVFSSKQAIQIPKRFRKILLYFSSFSYLNTLSVLLVISMDAMMIAHYLDLKATGIYTTIIYLTSAAMIPYRSLIRVSSPKVAEFWKRKDLKALQDIYQKSSSVGLLFALTVFLIIWVPIQELFNFIPAYRDGIYVFLFLMLGRMVDMYCGLNGAIFSTSRKFKFDLVFSVFLCATVFVLNILLIPSYGIVGAAVSTSFAYIVYNVLRCFYIYKMYGLHPFKVQQFKVIGVFSLFILLYLGFENKVMSIDYLALNPFWSVVFILGKWLTIFSGFILPVYIFKFEENSVNFIDSIIKRWFNKKQQV